MDATVIQSDLKIEGNLVSKNGTVSIAGQVTGDIDAKELEILPKGTAKGEVTADTVKISGTLHGRVQCGSLALDENSNLVADVTAGTMKMSSGARISGRIETKGG